MSNDQIDDRLNELGATLQRQPSVRAAVMRRVTEAAATRNGRSTSWRPSRRSIGKLLAVAACALIVALVWNTRGGPGAQEAFAQAIANVAKARTFSCIQIYKPAEGGGEEAQESAVMFKEPDRERIEYRKGDASDVQLTDYTRRRRLLLNKDKTSTLQDISLLYTVEEKTGKLKPEGLSTSVRDQVLKISAQAVKDLGMSKLGDQQVRVLRSQGDAEPIKTVYVNPKTGMPVQIELSYPTSKSSWTFASIQIDAELDDALFSLEVPPGYAPPKEERVDYSDSHTKMALKMRHLVMACSEYSWKHDNQFPAELADLTKNGMDEKALKTLLAAPDEPDGPAVIVYRRPRQGNYDGDVIVAYESPEHRREGKVVAGFWDGHVETMTQEYFEELMKK